MKKAILALLLVPCCIGFSFAQAPPVITSWKINVNNTTGYAGILADCQKVQYDSNDVYVSCTDIPDYNIGPWMGDPNVPSNQNFIYKITRNPVQNTGTPMKTPLGHVGVWINGVSDFNAKDAKSYHNDDTWHTNAEVLEASSFDACDGHADQTGEYHNHINPICLYDYQDSTHHSPIIGYAFDGFPIYGIYGYSDTDGTGGIRRMRSSYQLRTNMVNRDSLPDGTALDSADYGPDVNATNPLGTFVEDYKYVPGSGDLDAHNGRFCVTPEYPNGTYAYFVTVDANFNPVYPYTIGPTYYGIVQQGNIGPSGGHNTVPANAVTYSPTAIYENTLKINFSISPNPVVNKGYISFGSGTESEITATLYDGQGKVLKKYTGWRSNKRYTIDMSSFSAGIYLLHIQEGKNEATEKFVKL